MDLTATINNSVDQHQAIRLLKERVARIPNVLATPAPDVDIIQFTPAGPQLCVRPYCSNQHHWQVYFDTNRLIRESFGEAGFPAPVPANSVSGVIGPVGHGLARLEDSRRAWREPARGRLNPRAPSSLGRAVHLGGGSILEDEQVFARPEETQFAPREILDCGGVVLQPLRLLAQQRVLLARAPDRLLQHLELASLLDRLEQPLFTHERIHEEDTSNQQEGVLDRASPAAAGGGGARSRRGRRRLHAGSCENSAFSSKYTREVTNSIERTGIM